MMRKQLLKTLEVNLNLESLILSTSALLRDYIDESEVGCFSIFDSATVPSISLQNYLRRIQTYTVYTPECLVIAIIYMDRYGEISEDFNVTWNNVHHLLLTCLRLATKFHDDQLYDNKAYQTAGGVPLHVLNEFQIEIFKVLEYNLCVDTEQYQLLRQNLQNVYGRPE